METVEQDGQANSQIEGRLIIPNFDNTEIAFSSKSDSELKNAHLLFRSLGSNLLMKVGKHATLVALRLRLPIQGIVKKTIFRQFCGGETIAECAQTTKILDQYNIGTILDYSVEGKEEEKDFEHTKNEILETIRVAHNNPHIPFCVFKVTGLCNGKVLEQASKDEAGLNPAQKDAFKRLEDRVFEICSKSAQTGTPIFIDAEDSWYQDAIDRLAMKMIKRFNREEPIVYNTLQMYRHDRLAHMKEKIEEAKREGFIYAVKLVRGAYMEKERERAEEKGYPSPIQPDKQSTDRDFDAAMLLALENLENCAIAAGTHNEHSSMLLATEIDRRGINRNNRRLFFAQLFGMSDHISFNLSNAGYNVAKYVPYGPVKEVMPYLIRRAEENTSVAGQTGRELGLIRKEINRRKRNS